MSGRTVVKGRREWLLPIKNQKTRLMRPGFPLSINACYREMIP
jgi:hypothetical protein